MTPLLKSITQNSVGLAVFAVCTVGLIALTYTATEERIHQQSRAYAAKVLMDILPAASYDNVLLDTTVALPPAPLLATTGETKAFVAYKGYPPQQPGAVIVPAWAPDGYNGRIELLVGIYWDGTLAGVRVTNHQETPGLGDKIDTRISDWMLGFNGKSLTHPKGSGWAVRKDGGQFDQFTGATVTPRAVVAAVYRALQYFASHKEQFKTVP